TTPPIGAATQRPVPLQDAFQAAGAEFGVPAALLAAIGYVESGWDGRHGLANDYKQYGVMGLRTPPGGSSLEQAAALIGRDPAVLQTDDTANIRGAAALLRRIAIEGQGAMPVQLAGWYEVVAHYSESPDRWVARSYAWSVFQV